jgi:hypothetical protein
MSLKLFDLAGIAYFSKDESVFGADSSATAELVRECYTPEGYENLYDREICRPALVDYWPSTRTWISAIISHPMAYAVHRLVHFNSELFFIVPRNHPNYRVLLKQDPGKIASYLISNLSVFGLMIGAVIVGLCYRSSRPRSSELDDAIACMGISGVTYTLAYLIVGVSTQPRYQYWSLMAIFIASIIFLSNRGWGEHDLRETGQRGLLVEPTQSSVKNPISD